MSTKRIDKRFQIMINNNKRIFYEQVYSTEADDVVVIGGCGRRYLFFGMFGGE